MTTQKAGFFCARPNGTLTPLIPLDELEQGFGIKGLTRTIDVNGTNGMTSCGVAPARKETWAIDDTCKKLVAGPEVLAKLRGILVEILKVDAAPEKLREEVSALLRKGLDSQFSTFEQAAALIRAQNAAKRSPVSSNDTNALDDVLTNNRSNIRSSSARIGSVTVNVTTNSKVSLIGLEVTNMSLTFYFAGCLFRHHLPTDDESLDVLTLRDIPRWFREKYKLPSVLRYGVNARAMFKFYVEGVYKKLLDLGVMAFATDFPDVNVKAVDEYYKDKKK